MKLSCANCLNSLDPQSETRTLIKFGKFYRRSDSQWIQRFKCLSCKRHFSIASSHPCYRQKKRNKNHLLRELLCSGISQRRLVRILSLNRKTVVKKMLFLAKQAEFALKHNLKAEPKSQEVEFDDLETFEHTKCKPLSVMLAVEYKTRKILGFEISQMAAKGHLAKIAFSKYGPREDQRAQGRKKLFLSLQDLVEPKGILRSDSNPHYCSDVKKYFPDCVYQTVLGARGAVTGQGELKKKKFDPIFSLNHTCAMLRANINRLFRQTWCTTKRPDRLQAHLMIYANYHNEILINKTALNF